YIAGHTGLVGSAILRRLSEEGFSGVLTATHNELDLRDQAAVTAWFEANRPEYVFLVAGMVGGILANASRPADFIYDNAMIHANVVHASYVFDVHKLLYLGSSCVYPRDAEQPLKEEALLTGPLEPTNEAYAVAKIAGIKLCQAFRAQHGCNFISAMPTNLYGPNDNFGLANSHVVPALIRKFHDAKHSQLASVEVWGTGSARREFMHVDDLADACLFLMRNYSAPQHINVGSGTEISIRVLAELVREVVYPDARIVWDATKPEGTPRKLCDVSRLSALGWNAAISLPDGIRATYEWFENALVTEAART
ncbi:MAG: GDP-L-fucose synthase family protein, partial [Acidimicrobiales bacterium]